MSQKKRGFFAGVSTLAAAALLLAAGGQAAMAAPTIDPEAEGTIHFHKFEQPDELGGAADGLPKSADDLAGLTAMSGVTFQAQQVGGVDLRTNDGWLDAADMTVEAAKAAVTGPKYTSGATDANGDATIAGLPVGLYLITEADYPAGVTPSAPFLVTVPLTNPSELNDWLYEIHVYPKNAAAITPEKTVEDADAVNVGDEITWTITSEIPKVEVLDGFKMVDELDAKLQFVSITLSLTDGTPIDQSAYTLTEDGQTITVEATPAGLEALAALWQAKPGVKLQAELVTQVIETGEIANEATIFPNKPSFDVDPGEPGGPIVTPPAVSKFGNIVLKKVDAKDDKVLQGAEFQVFRSEAEALAGTDPIEIDGETTFVSNENGIVLIEGLRYTAFADGEILQPGDDDYRTYWIVETKAPKTSETTYELLAEPIEVIVDSASTEIVTEVVKNVPTNGDFDLPLTGATGTAALTVAGILLLAGALVLGSRRKASN